MDGSLCSHHTFAAAVPFAAISFDPFGPFAAFAAVDTVAFAAFDIVTFAAFDPLVAFGPLNPFDPWSPSLEFDPFQAFGDFDVLGSWETSWLINVPVYLMSGGLPKCMFPKKVNAKNHYRNIYSEGAVYPLYSNWY